ncbi:hypothetical protein JS528_03035 [Bifidobacterium sp. MA2]|uniref:DUF2975 domain-containing protein n=1 Tax=Bifidobacterium santillanense TaxID=2809028 RepID=A0ABS5UN86_9BIFI|nr:hypothetical protein [Bifidobacterium santillanense]MBT1172351.1 hypothetical protein [Bifidobacterium santillanense]
MDRTTSKAAARGRLAKASSFALFIARAGEVLYVLSAAIMLILEVLYFALPEAFVASDDGYGASYPIGGARLNITGGYLGSEVRLARWGSDGTTMELNPPSVIIAGLTVLAISVLMVLTFHEVARMCVDMRRWMRDPDGTTPFGVGLAPRLMRIGTYLIAVPAITLVSDAALLVLTDIGGSTNPMGLFVYLLLGILAILLSRVFDYGAALQEDVDGLL